MSYDVTAGEYLGEYRIRLTFENGRSGVVDFQPYLRLGGVFQRLEDMEFFRRFEISPDLGTITWGQEIDVAPETLYSQAIGEPLPEWMQETVVSS